MVTEDNSDGGGGDELDYDFLSYELEYLSVYGYRPNKESSSTWGGDNGVGGFDLEDDLLFSYAQHRSHHMSQLQSGYAIVICTRH